MAWPLARSALQLRHHPIENTFAKLKALLRKAAERTKDALWAAIGPLVEQITPAECVNMFATAGYDAA